MTTPKLDVAKDINNRAPDLVLATYVQVANAQTEDTETLPMTLQVQGMLVTGELIPNWLWAAEHHALQQKAAGKELPSSEFKRWQEEFERRRDEDAAVSDADWEGMSEAERAERVLYVTPGFIHLRRAKMVYAGGTLIPTAGTLWRGRLTQVDAWFPGLLGEASA